ncbi:MAG: hypothetical protein AAGE43_20735, partial [Pseudomonadota bacterium]
AEIHARAFRGAAEALPIGGLHKFRRKGETHAWGANLLHQMQKAVDTGSYDDFKTFSETVLKRSKNGRVFKAST